MNSLNLTDIFIISEYRYIILPITIRTKLCSHTKLIINIATLQLTSKQRNVSHCVTEKIDGLP